MLVEAKRIRISFSIHFQPDWKSDTQLLKYVDIYCLVGLQL